MSMLSDITSALHQEQPVFNKYGTVSVKRKEFFYLTVDIGIVNS